MMKKVTLIVTFITMMVLGTATYSATVQEVDFLIKQDLEKNKFLIVEKSKDLTPEQKFMLINTNQKGAGLPFALNFFLGLGIGSYVQGDIGGGISATGGEVLGIALMSQENTAGTGALLFLGFRIFEWIRPFSYASGYNNKLSMSLYSYDTKIIGNDVSLAISPEIKNISTDTENESNIGYGLKLSLNY